MNHAALPLRSQHTRVTLINDRRRPKPSRLAWPQDESLANPPRPACLPSEAICALDWDERFGGSFHISFAVIQSSPTTRHARLPKGRYMWGKMDPSKIGNPNLWKNTIYIQRSCSVGRSGDPLLSGFRALSRSLSLTSPFFLFVLPCTVGGPNLSGTP